MPAGSVTNHALTASMCHTRNTLAVASSVAVSGGFTRPKWEQFSMQIYGPFRVSTTQNTSGVQRSQPQKPVESNSQARSAEPVDQLDLTNAATATNRLDESSAIAGNGEIRIDRVADIRRQIAEGTYETAERLDAAIERMLDQFA
jgi:negative regulator of flagellin synthesis FlgM